MLSKPFISNSFFQTLILLSAFLAPATIFLSLPPFYVGVWVQIGFGAAYLHIVAGVGLVGLAGLIFFESQPARLAVSHPMVLLPVVMAILSIIQLPFSTMPNHSLFGTPEHGFGIVTFLDVAALTGIYIFVCTTSRCYRWILVETFLILGVVFLLDYLFRGERTWAPFFFGDYLAYFAVFVFTIALTLSPKHLILSGMLVIAFIGLIILSDNKAGLLAAAIVAPAWLALWRFGNNKISIIVAACFVMPILATLVNLTVGALFEESFRLSLRQNVPFEELLKLGIYSAEELDDHISSISELIVSSWASLWSRSMLGFIVIWQIMSEPWLLLKGTGWGHFNEALLQNLTEVEGRLHELIGESSVYWDAIRRNDFHSHNQFLEALLATGISGMLIFLVYHAALPYFSKKVYFWPATFLSLFLAVLNSFWFQMPQSLPLMALAIGILCGNSRSIAFRLPYRTALGTTVTAAACGLIISGVCVLSESLDSGEKLAQIRNVAKMPHEKLIRPVNVRELWESHQVALLQLLFGNLKETRGANDKTSVIYEKFLFDELNSYSSNTLQTSSTALIVTFNNVLSGLYFQMPELRNRFREIFNLWPPTVRALLSNAPKRSELIIPYFNLLLGSGRENELLSLAESFLSLNNADPVSLWFSGLVYLNQPEHKAEGFRKMRLSLKLGIQDLMPVSEELKRLLAESD